MSLVMAILLFLKCLGAIMILFSMAAMAFMPHESDKKSHETVLEGDDENVTTMGNFAIFLCIITALICVILQIIAGTTIRSIGRRPFPEVFPGS